MKTFEEFNKKTIQRMSELSKEQQRKDGAHYTTNLDDIMKIIGPCIVDDWLEKKDPEYGKFLTYTVFDPACGTGNFLFVAYLELKKIEKKLFGADKDLYSLSNLIGIEYDPDTGRVCFDNLIACCERPEYEKPKIIVGDALALDWKNLAQYKDKCVS